MGGSGEEKGAGVGGGGGERRGVGGVNNPGWKRVGGGTTVRESEGEFTTWTGP